MTVDRLESVAQAGDGGCMLDLEACVHEEVKLWRACKNKRVVLHGQDLVDNL